MKNKNNRMKPIGIALLFGLTCLNISIAQPPLPPPIMEKLLDTTGMPLVDLPSWLIQGIDLNHTYILSINNEYIVQGPVNNIVSVLPGGSNDAVNLAIGGYLSFDDIRMNTVRDIKFSVDTDLQGDFYGGLAHYTNANVVSNIDSMDLFVQNISLELNSKQSNTNGRIISGYTAVNLEFCIK